MKHTMKLLLLALLAMTVLVLAGCSGEKDQYALNDEAGYTVSVQYHANGGQFATNTYTMTDSYKVDGKTELMLLDPNDSTRKESFKAQRNGYFLAGWYTGCTETGEIAADGQPVCTYSGYWDFATDTVAVEKGKTYTASEPVLHLYAAWIPNYTFEFYDLSTGELVDTTSIDPTDPKQLELELSYWDEGTLRKKDIPTKKGYTYAGLYLDADGTQQVTEKSIFHSGEINIENATATNSVMKLYVDYMEGEFQAVFTAQEFVDTLSYGGDMIIMEDLDFAEVQWSDLIWSGEYTGKILGNGHTLSNISVKIAPEDVTNMEYTYAGLFGKLGEGAKLADLKIKDLKLEICEGTDGLRRGEIFNDISIGILAGEIAEEAVVENVTVEGCTILLPLKIETYSYDLNVDDYDVTVTLTGTDAELYTTEIVDGKVKIVEIPQEEPEEEEKK